MKIYHYWQDFKPEFKKISKIVTDHDRICYLCEEKSLKQIFECYDTDTLYYDGSVSLTLFYKLNKEQKKKWKNFLKQKE
jgi:ABC-type Zn uptake system ZnuABC Zn-binding protein ZnuA